MFRQERKLRQPASQPGRPAGARWADQTASSTVWCRLCPSAH